MFVRRVIRFAFAEAKVPAQKLPKAPKLLSGELQPFRFDAESARIFDGYTLDELYGSKIGLKHSPAVLSEMRKDSIASILLFVLGFGIIWHLHKIHLKQLDQLNNLNDGRLNRKVTLPAGLQNNLKTNFIVLDEVHL